MACDRYEGYVGNGARQHLDQLKADAIQDITEVLEIEPQLGIPDDELFNRKHSHLNKYGPHFIVTPSGRVTPRFFEGNARIIEIDDLTWRYHRNRTFFGRGNRGEYKYKAGMIFLHKPIWCRHTLIHEVLHGTSVFSRINIENYPEFRSHRSLREGITDTLTGYILNQKYPECYEAWLGDRYPQCKIAGYRPRVRLWCSLCQHIGVGGVAEFYLSYLDNIGEPWNQLQETVKDMGFPDFSYHLDERTPYNEMEFREVAFKSIPHLKDTYNDTHRSLDFTLVLP